MEFLTRRRAHVDSVAVPSLDCRNRSCCSSASCDYELNRRTTSRIVHRRSALLYQDSLPITDEELSAPGRFSWLIGNKLAEYIPGQHLRAYQEHSERIRKWQRNSRPNNKSFSHDGRA
jgi:hypothetical protein